MHPVLAQETIRDLSVRHQATIDAAERMNAVVTQEAERSVSRSTERRARIYNGIGGAIALVLALPKRATWLRSYPRP